MEEDADLASCLQKITRAIKKAISNGAWIDVSLVSVGTEVMSC